MLTALIGAAVIIISLGIVFHWIDSAYEDYREYYETQTKNADR